VPAAARVAAGAFPSHRLVSTPPAAPVPAQPQGLGGRRIRAGRAGVLSNTPMNVGCPIR